MTSNILFLFIFKLNNLVFNDSKNNKQPHIKVLYHSCYLSVWKTVRLFSKVDQSKVTEDFRHIKKRVFVCYAQSMLCTTYQTRSGPGAIIHYYH